MVTAGTQCFASSRDKNPIYSDITYYGVIQEIIELDYWVGKKVVLFKCDWVSSGRGLKQDDLGFTLVNFSRRMSDKEPFILASQAQQVFYVPDPIDSQWQVVIRTQPRDLCDMIEVEQDGDVDEHLQSETCNMIEVEQEMHSDDDNVDWIRSDVRGDLVDDPGESTAPNTSGIPDTEIEDDGVDHMETDEYNY
ncbi:unnamed protein product [Linum trigynum]|uniref:DUF4216 domain-containing protein n=1 Tax=Linum trigynum TaxID=586398 RepID=A0AAV2FRH7_9ROSI